MPDIKCPHCGSLVPQGSKFCNNCGAPLDQEIQCPHCNSVIPANSVFCPVCHNIVGKAADAGGDQQQSAGENDMQMPSGNSVKRPTPLSIQSMGYCPSSKVSQKAQNISAACSGKKAPQKTT